MATRFYLPTASSAAVSPAYNAGWEISGGADTRQKLVTTRTNSSFATSTFSQAQGGGTLDFLSRQFVSDPILGDQTISGTLKGQMLMSEGATTHQFTPNIMAYVFNNAGTTLRGTLYAGETRTTNVDEITTTLTNAKNPAAGISPVTLSSVSALDGDRIVVEIGGRAMSAGVSPLVLNVRYGDNNASDLTEGGTETTDLNPWVEFSQTINLLGQLTQGVGMVPIA